MLFAQGSHSISFFVLLIRQLQVDISLESWQINFLADLVMHQRFLNLLMS